MGALKRWLSLRAYGLVTSTLFGATTSPLKMCCCFERLSVVSREKMQGKFPRIAFGDHVAGNVPMNPSAFTSRRHGSSCTCTAALSSWVRLRRIETARCA